MADVVLSDMAAPASGHKRTDHLKIMALCEAALEFACEVLKPGRCLLAKVLQGGAEHDLLDAIKRISKPCGMSKPKASRQDSSELYVSGERAFAALTPVCGAPDCGFAFVTVSDKHNRQPQNRCVLQRRQVSARPQRRAQADRKEVGAMAIATRDGSFQEYLTFDDVLLKPGRIRGLPGEADTRTRLTRDIELTYPDDLIRHGHGHRGASGHCHGPGRRHGVVHRNMDPDMQAEHVRRVKKFESGMVVNPLTITPEATLADALALMDRHKISGIPVTERRPMAVPRASSSAY